MVYLPESVYEHKTPLYSSPGNAYPPFPDELAPAFKCPVPAVNNWAPLNIMGAADSQGRNFRRDSDTADERYYLYPVPVFPPPGNVTYSAYGPVNKPLTWSSSSSSSNGSPITPFSDTQSHPPPLNYSFLSNNTHSIYLQQVPIHQSTPFSTRFYSAPVSSSAASTTSLWGFDSGFPPTSLLLPGAMYGTADESPLYNNSSVVPSRLFSPFYVSPTTELSTSEGAVRDISLISLSQRTSSTSTLGNALGGFEFNSGQQVVDGTHFDPGLDSVHVSPDVVVTMPVADTRTQSPFETENQDSRETVLEQSMGHINSFCEEEVETQINKFDHVTGGGPSTSSGEAAAMLNNEQAERGQRFGGPAKRAPAPRRNGKRKAVTVGAPLSLPAPKRARAEVSSQPPTCDGNRPLDYRIKNQKTGAPPPQDSSFNQKMAMKMIGISYHDPDELEGFENKSKRKVKKGKQVRKEITPL